MLPVKLMNVFGYVNISSPWGSMFKMKLIIPYPPNLLHRVVEKNKEANSCENLFGMEKYFTIISVIYCFPI